jgi:hypothetical protein
MSNHTYVVLQDRRAIEHPFTVSAAQGSIPRATSQVPPKISDLAEAYFVSYMGTEEPSASTLSPQSSVPALHFFHAYCLTSLGARNPK